MLEARAAARLQHPNVLTVYRVGELDGRPYLITEFIRGKTLDEVETPMPWGRALELGVGLARGLAAAHRRGVLHRDIKPEQRHPHRRRRGQAPRLRPRQAPRRRRAARDPALAAPGAPRRRAAARPPRRRARSRPAPRDGGATLVSPARRDERRAPGAAAERRAAPLTDAGALMGTPDYMAPELWRGEPATRRSDVYALGALLFELCAGRPPHRDAARRARSRSSCRSATRRSLTDARARRSAPSSPPSSSAACAATRPSASPPATSCARRWSSSRSPSRARRHPRGQPLPRPARLRGRAPRALLRPARRGRARSSSGSASSRWWSSPATPGVGKSSLCRAGRAARGAGRRARRRARLVGGALRPGAHAAARARARALAPLLGARRRRGGRAASAPTRAPRAHHPQAARRRGRAWCSSSTSSRSSSPWPTPPGPRWSARRSATWPRACPACAC